MKNPACIDLSAKHYKECEKKKSFFTHTTLLKILRMNTIITIWYNVAEHSYSFKPTEY